MTDIICEQADTNSVAENPAELHWPKDLYIPPDALKVVLETFEGPLDVLLYLIKRQNLDILDIPIVQITRQYMHYIDVMQNLNLALAAEYLLMAAMLAEIKSRLLLPRPADIEAGEEDPRAELVRRLQEYERFKQAAAELDALPRVERDIVPIQGAATHASQEKPLPAVAMDELIAALQSVLARAQLTANHHIKREVLSIRERMMIIMQSIQQQSFARFTDLFMYHEGRAGVVVTFIAILELIRQSVIELVQSAPFEPIHIKAKSAKSAQSL